MAPVEAAAVVRTVPPTIVVPAQVNITITDLKILKQMAIPVPTVMYFQIYSKHFNAYSKREIFGKSVANPRFFRGQRHRVSSGLRSKTSEIVTAVFGQGQAQSPLFQRSPLRSLESTVMFCPKRAIPF